MSADESVERAARTQAINWPTPDGWAAHHDRRQKACPACDGACPVADDGEPCCEDCQARWQVYVDAGACPHGWLLKSAQYCSMCSDPSTAPVEALVADAIQEGRDE